MSFSYARGSIYVILLFLVHHVALSFSTRGADSYYVALSRFLLLMIKRHLSFIVVRETCILLYDKNPVFLLFFI